MRINRNILAGEFAGKVVEHLIIDEGCEVIGPGAFSKSTLYSVRILPSDKPLKIDTTAFDFRAIFVFEIERTTTLVKESFRR